MLTTTLATLFLAAAATAAPCTPSSSHRFQWAGATPLAGWLAVSTSRIDQSGSHVDNGQAVLSSGDYLRYTNIYWEREGNPGVMRLQGYNKCLDAGLSPANGTPLKVWDCYPGVMQQTWRLHDGFIELEGKGLCVDVPNGQAGPVTAQLWQCAQGNPNQQWKTLPGM